MSRLERAASLIGLIVFLVNPGMGCSADEFGFGQEEMRAAAAGTWRVTGPGINATFTLDAAVGVSRTAQASSLIRSALACGNREFFRGAAACVDVSVLHLEGKIVESSPGFQRTAVTGAFRVYGKDLRPGYLEVVLPDGSKLGVSMVDATGATFVGTLSRGSGEESVSFTMERLSR
jgi:hypothetical protein